MAPALCLGRQAPGDRQGLGPYRPHHRGDARACLHLRGAPQLRQCARALPVRHLAARRRRGANLHHDRHDVPRRRGGDPAQPASADGRPGPLPADPCAARLARRRAVAADRPRLLRADAVLFLRAADAADRAYERHGGRPDVDSARHGRARLWIDADLRRMQVVTLGATNAGATGRGQAVTFALAVVPITLLLLGFPIFMVLLTAVTVALVFFMHVPLAALHQNLFASVNGFALLAIPFFIYAGELMGRGSVAQRLVDFVQGGVGSVRGSLGVTAVGTSAIFGAISGASAATVATIGRVMVPAMRRAGYPETFTAGLITAVGAIDVIIPPSIPMIVYGAAAEESVARLYAAGVLPGLLIAGMLAAYVVWRAKREDFGAGEPFQLRAFLRAAVRSLWGAGSAGYHPGRHLWGSVLPYGSRRR